jgi:hypothetical protein
LRQKNTAFKSIEERRAVVAFASFARRTATTIVSGA